MYVMWRERERGEERERREVGCNGVVGYYIERRGGGCLGMCRRERWGGSWVNTDDAKP